MVSNHTDLKKHSFLRVVTCHPGDLEHSLTALFFISELVSARDSNRSSQG
jgi:hypothetical protein